MKFIYLLFIIFTSIGCTNCGIINQDPMPHVVVYDGTEYCQPMCEKFKELGCAGYWEDIVDNDGGIITCQSFCSYELYNGINLNPKCFVDTLKYCAEIESICK